MALRLFYSFLSVSCHQEYVRQTVGGMPSVLKPDEMLHDRQRSCRLRAPRDLPGGGRAVDRIPKMSVHAAYTCAQPMYTGAVLSHDRECGVPAGHTSHRESDASGRPC